MDKLNEYKNLVNTARGAKLISRNSNSTLNNNFTGNNKNIQIALPQKQHRKINSIATNIPSNIPTSIQTNVNSNIPTNHVPTNFGTLLEGGMHKKTPSFNSLMKASNSNINVKRSFSQYKLN